MSTFKNTSTVLAKMKSTQNQRPAKPRQNSSSVASVALDRLEELLGGLFPHGDIQGEEFQVGNLGGEQGSSLKPTFPR